tara:strand:+ start:125 stop:364 length:240 start_codon:yes stop_codon:yes gene_type:complete
MLWIGVLLTKMLAGSNMSKELRKLMKTNNFFLLRQKNHLVWKHIYGAQITTPKTPRRRDKEIKNTMRVIKKEIGFAIPV